MNEPLVVWIVDDDRGVRLVLSAALREAGFAVREFTDAESVRDALIDNQPALLFTDVRMPGASGLQLLEHIHPCVQFPVIVMSAFTDVASTAAAYRHGAFDFLPKPFDLDLAVDMARRALAQAELIAVISPRTLVETDLLGRSSAMREVFRVIGRAAASGLNVLITGETGTGKELVAQALHRESARANKAFVALNTAAIPAELLESELFGHEAGAFTGAMRRHAGRFEQAQGGTLFLDEIGDMPLALQTRLLRVLAQGDFYRVGGRELILADVRVMAATHQVLEDKVMQGTFRADLLHRLDVVRIHLPSLHERREDIPLLAEHFINRACTEIGVASKRFSTGALKQLTEHDWPGNVRQLENICRRLAVMVAGRKIDVADLSHSLQQPRLSSKQSDWVAALRDWTEQALIVEKTGIHAQARSTLEQTLFDVALAVHNGHRQNAAKALGLGRNTLTRKLGSSRARK